MARPEVKTKRVRAKAVVSPDAKRGFQAVDRALGVLETLGEDAEGYRLTDLAVRTGLAASTLHRLLTALEQRRFVQFDRLAATWHVGPKLFAIGSTFARRRNLTVAALPVLRALRDRTRETANLGVADTGSIVVVAQIESREVVRAIAVVGGRVPMINDALGKAILATLEEADIAAIIAQHGMPRVTARSIVRAGSLHDELKSIRSLGYAVDRGEYVEELRCVAAAIVDPYGIALGAISVSGVASRMPDARIAEFGPVVAAAARDLTIAIGGGTASVGVATGEEA